MTSPIQNQITKYTNSPAKFSTLTKNKQTTFPICCICLEDFVSRSIVRESRLCDHIFHRRCIDDWIRTIRGLECPICRTKPEGFKKYSSYRRNDEIIQERRQPIFVQIIQIVFYIASVSYLFTIIYAIIYNNGIK